MSIPVTFDDIHHKKIVQSLRDSIEKELLKVENKQYTKTSKKKTAKAIKQVLYNSLKPEKFKVEVTPMDDSRFYVEIEPKVRVIKTRIKKKKNETTKLLT